MRYCNDLSKDEHPGDQMLMEDMGVAIATGP